MIPTWQSDCVQVQLYLGDCREVLPHLGKVDAVVTDPPYGIGFKYDQHEDIENEYSQTIFPVIEFCKTVKGAKVFWQAMKYADKWHEWFPPGFRIFACAKGFVQFRPTAVQYSWDPVIFWGDLQGEPSVYKKDYHLQSLAPFGSGREKIDHPCPRPTEQVEYIVDIFSMPSDVVLDPYMGSGTTGIACLITGRRFIGIEISEKYFTIAKERIQRELSQLKLPL